MNNVVTFPSEPRVREQAALWIARLDRGLRPGERQELGSWLSESPQHRDGLMELAALWDQMDVLNEISTMFPLEPRPSRWRRLWVPAAALPVLVLLAIAILGLWSTVPRPPAAGAPVKSVAPEAVLEAEYQTRIGEQRMVMLPDQSAVTLNTATRMRAHYTASDRLIELLAGEAHFEVAKHQRRVFTVKVGDNLFKAVGTAFDIRVQSARGIELTVTEGRVQVLVPSVVPSQTLVAADASAPATEIMVDAGKAVAIGSARQTVERLDPARMQAAVTWRTGMIAFDGVPLEQAIQEVERYSTTRFVIADEATQRIPVSGYFRVGDTDGLIAALHSNFQIDAMRGDDTITLSSRRR